MPQQRNLPESMDHRTYVELAQAKRSTEDSVGVPRNINARLLNPFQNIGKVRRRQGRGWPCVTQQLMTDIAG